MNTIKANPFHIISVPLVAAFLFLLSPSARADFTVTSEPNPVWSGSPNDITITGTEGVSCYGSWLFRIRDSSANWVVTHPPVTFPATVVHTWTPQYPDLYQAVGAYEYPPGDITFWTTNIYAITSDSDVDENNLLDGWEYGYWGHLGESEFDNPDGDLLNNRQEWEAGTDPLDWDSDDDGNPDGFENPPPEIGRDAHILEYQELASHNTGGNSKNEAGEYRWYFDDQKTWLLEPVLNELRQPDAGEFIILKVYYDHERNGNGSAKEFGIYELLRDWGEGEGSGIDGREALVGEANWIWAKKDTDLWETPGAKGPTDAETTPTLTFTVTDNYGPLLFDVTAAMTPYITDPSGFHGFKIENTTPEPEVHGTKVFASYQHLNADRHPRLYVGTMDLPPELELTVEPTAGQVPLEVTVEITATDPDGTVETVMIDYGDGDTEEITYTGPISRMHTYISKGTYIIVVTATDDDSLTATASETIEAIEAHTGDFAVDPLYGVPVHDGLPGDTIILTSTTITFEGTPIVKFGGVPAGTVEIVSPSELSAELPEGALSGFVTVNMSGDLYTSGDYFHVLELLSSTGKDAHILEYATLSTNNTGMNAQMDAGEYNIHLVDRKTVLIEPDLDGISTPGVNEIYYLELYFEGERNGIGEAKSFGLYTLLREWEEGNGLGINGRSAIDDEVTWYSASLGQVEWEIPGALGATDSEQQPEGAVSIADKVGWIRIPVTEAIAEILPTPGEFHGFKLQELSPLSAYNGSKIFATYQSEYAHHKPRITKAIEGPPPGYPVIGLEIDPMIGEPPLTCDFTVYATDDGTVESLHIDFGDTTDATLDPAIVNEFPHTYSDTGNFLVQVTATDDESHVWVEEREVVVELTSPITFDLDPAMGKVDDVITLVSTEITFWGTPIVEIAGVPAAAAIVDADHISVTIPGSAQSGWVELVIDGTRYTSSERFILLEVLSTTGLDAHILENMPTRNTGGYFENEIGEFNWTLNLDEKTYLIEPDLTGVELPEGTDFSVYLEIKFDHERNGSGYPKTFGLYELLKDWNEGTGAGWIDGQEAVSGEVTWNSAKHLEQTWETTGAKGVTDAEQTPLDTVTLSDNYGLFRLDVTEAIIDALETPSAYNGFKLQEELPLPEANGTKVLHSYQSPNPDVRPRLVLADTWAWGDTDGDDMPNQWETQYGFDPNDPSDATEDLDGDGYLNVYEYVHETDPGDPAQIPPATITVTTTIQDAIDAAVNDYDIVMVPDGTYTGTGNRDLDFHGKIIMVTSVGVVENCIVDCEESGRGIHFHTGEDRRSVVRGLTIRNGGGGIEITRGGGIFCNGSSPTILRCHIHNCSATSYQWQNGEGGGIACYSGGSPAIRNCVITLCSASLGGGIACDFGGSPAIRNCVITLCSGGGIAALCGSYPAMMNCTVNNNGTALLSAYGANISLYNSIVWGGGIATHAGGQITPEYSDIQGGYPGEGNIDSDPVFTANCHLQYNSPCIDAGDNDYVPGDTDFDGELRIVDGDGDTTATVDMGADEYLDSDGDNLPDWWETLNNLDPNDSTGDNGADGDPDGDDMSNLQEYQRGTDPNDPLSANVTFYADVNNATPVHPYRSWSTAATTIQDAVDTAIDGDLVLVTNGTYETGSAITPGHSCSNRLVITNNITVRSVNGSEFTIIKGAESSGGVRGSDAVRGVYMSDGILDGFTVTIGHTMKIGDLDYDLSGGGINMYGGSGVVSNCIITGNSTLYLGGGAYHGILNNCIISDNKSLWWNGGGTYESTLNNCTITANNALYDGGGTCYGNVNNCTITGNSAAHGGGTHYGLIKNCTINANHASYYGGGVFDGSLINCIIHNNSAGYNGNNWDDLYGIPTIINSCTTPLPPGEGNIDTDPGFTGQDNLHLMYGSPCINTGTNESWMSYAVDIDGENRILDGNVDMGCDEYLDSDGDNLPDWWETLNNLDPNDSTGENGADGDPDGDDMSNLFEFTYGFDPNDPDDATEDIDGDGYLNVYECVHQTDPTDAGQIPPATIIVTGTIQAAIDAVTNDYDIVMVPDGTYTDGGNRDIQLRGKVIMVTSSNGSTACIIDCEEWGGGFWIHENEDLRSVIGGFSIINARLPYAGAGIYADSSPTITDCLVSNALSYYNPSYDGGYGGGVYLGGNATLDRITVIDCSTEHFGGGIYCATGAAPTLLNCRIVENAVTDATNNIGGGIYIDGNATIQNCTIANNDISSASGCGIHVGNGTPIMRNCIVWGTESNQFTVATSSTPVITYSNIKGGYTGEGNIAAEPQFASVKYRLTSSSPCIDAGSLTNAPLTDWEEESRWDDPAVSNISSIVDIGVDEYVDTDGDGLPDWWEIDNNLDPNDSTGDNGANGDPDNDGLGNTEEYNSNCNPHNSDTDGDGLTDGDEVNSYYTNPTNSDTDGDGLPDKWEIDNNLDPNDSTGDNGADGDPDADGLNNAEEYQRGSDPNDPLNPNVTFYADVNNATPVHPYRSWSTAATTIQDAVDTAIDGDLVLVTNGTYETGSAITPGHSCSNRLVITNNITVRSVNGSEFTVIKGAESSGGGCGSDAVRGVYMSDGILDGFTITNGHTRNSGNWKYDMRGGGINMYGGSGVVINCTITGNSAADSGGGTAHGTLNNCTITGNSAVDGGGTHYGLIKNCTINANHASYYGGGVFDGSLINCIIHNNSAGYNGNNWDDLYGIPTIINSCTTPLPPGEGNIDTDPGFTGQDNLHLMYGSPCINTGTNESWMTNAVDIDGDARICDGIVDMGCDEFYASGLTGTLSAEILVNYTNTAVDFPVRFEAVTEGSLHGMFWNFGDGSAFSNNYLATYAFDATGDYSVVLTVSNIDLTVSATTTIHVVPGYTNFVSLSSTNPVSPYETWATAATNIQNGISANTLPGGVVLVSNGIYETASPTLSSRIAITNPVIVRAYNNTASTTIRGQSGIRCAYVGDDAMLDGFILSGASGVQYGGGTRCASSYAIIRNCNIYSNSALIAAGAYKGKIQNCTIVNNSSSYGAVAHAEAENSIIYYNDWPNISDTKCSYTCTTPLPLGGGNITNQPVLARTSSGAYLLSSQSPCINAGTNKSWMTNSHDMDGESRILNEFVDMGADEFCDNDNDLLPDSWELAWFADTNLSQTAYMDYDQDGIINLVEFWNGLDPVGSDPVSTVYHDSEACVDGYYLFPEIPVHEKTVQGLVYEAEVNISAKNVLGFFISSNPTTIGGWDLTGLSITIKTPSGWRSICGVGDGVVSNSMDVTDDMLAAITDSEMQTVRFRLVGHGKSFIGVDHPLYLLKWKPTPQLQSGFEKVMLENTSQTMTISALGEPPHVDTVMHFESSDHNVIEITGSSSVVSNNFAETTITSKNQPGVANVTATRGFWRSK